MKPQTHTATKLAISLPMDAIENFCQRWQIAELSVFADSDIDFLYVLKPNIQWRLVDLLGAEEELEKMLGCKIDLVKKSSIEQSHNWLRKQNILSSAKVIYDSK
jgi:predicted nucleotidyltransferase